MNAIKINKRTSSFIGAVVFLAASSVAQSQSPAGPVLALTSQGSVSAGSSAQAALSASSERSGSEYSVDFLPGSNEVAGVNFDIAFKPGSDVKITGCGESFKGTHIARCEMVNKGRIRVLIFSAPVEPMEAGEIFTFSVGSGASARIDHESVAVSDMSGNMIDPEVL